MTDSYITICKELYAQFLAKFHRSEEEARRFVTRGAAKKVLQYDMLVRLFQCLNLLDLGNLTHGDTNVHSLARKVNENSLQNFLAILIFSTCDIEPVRKFTIKLLVTDSWAAERCSLPTTRETLIELFEEQITPDQFLANQAMFCPVIILKGKEVIVSSLENESLPYMEEKLLGKGSFGAVYRVKIAKGHLCDPHFKSANQEPVELARKDYLTSADLRSQMAQEDHKIMKKILSLDKKCINIVESYGSLAIGSSTYSLFMPLAICDLKQYMATYHFMKPSTATERMEIIQNLHGVANGLDFLHTQMRTTEGHRLVCYHMDLKPDNILIYSERSGEEKRQVWKISDFGMARVKYPREFGDTDRANDLRSWFARRPKQESQDNSASGTINRRGEGTYLAPESMASFPIMKANSDVWSLGCVISVVFAYVEKGANGVMEYANDRADYVRSGGSDRFFIHQRNMAPSQMSHPAVKRWHKDLVTRAAQRSRHEGDATRFILSFLENAVFREQPKRCNAELLKDKLFQTWKRYSVSEAVSEHEEEQKFTWGRVLHVAKLRGFSRRLENQQEGDLFDRWLIDINEPLKGCEISHDASVIAFWTDTRIFLYTSQSLLPLGERTMREVASWELEEHKDNRILNSLSLTDRYLIVSTSGTFQFYLFDLQESDSPDICLENPLLIEENGLSEITKVAISPDSEELVFILRNNDQDHSRSALLYTTPVDSARDYKLLQRLKFRASEIIKMTFSANFDIYLVIRPDLTTGNHNHEISILQISLRKRSLKHLIIESRGVESSSIAGLFTTFVPYNKEPDICAVVTREKRLHIQTLQATSNLSKFKPSQNDIKNYRIVRIMLSNNDARIFAVGKPVASHKMLLLELVERPHKKLRDFSVEELVSIPGLAPKDEFKERLCEDEGETFVLLASLSAEGQRAIYKIRVPASSSYSPS